MLGEGRISTAGMRDFDSANNIAREMVYRCGFSRRLGPVALMSSEERFLHDARTRGVANISSELARIAMADIRDVRPRHDKGPLQSRPVSTPNAAQLSSNQPFSSCRGFRGHCTARVT